jgi:C4-dicarboxylate-specific signal transduction histidine kinase
VSDGGDAVSAVADDARELAAARASVLERERLATLGLLAGSVAHEINNPAAFMLLGVDLLERLLHGPAVTMEEGAAARASELLCELRGSIHRIVDISRDLRLFTRAFAVPAGGLGADADVNRIMESALNLIRGRIVERARIERSLGEVAPVRMDSGDLGQVIVTLLLRAAEAIDEAGAGDHVIFVATRSKGRAVEIEVRDTGESRPQEELGALPQNTSRAERFATDVGRSIAICRELVERAGGEMRTESPVEGTARGTRWVIALPAAGEG